MRGLRRYLVAALLPLCVLLAAPVRPALILMFGEEVRLATVPFDPRDLFRGDYVALHFAVEEIPLASFDVVSGGRAASRGTGGPEPAEMKLAKDWYVSLKRDASGIFSPEGVGTSPPVGRPYLRGTFRAASGGSVARLDFGPGLECFYLRENTGRALEDAARKGRIEAIVKVWRGMPVIVSLDVKPREPSTN
nr:GDYXXLXY domain-containing protein [uncultured Fretibacterium sp.]